MSAKQFAKLFIEDLPDTLKLKQNEHIFLFDDDVFKDDPNLKILRSELNKLNFDLIPYDDEAWKLVKLTK